MKKKNIENNVGNPFSDSQARNYSDSRVLQEFCPPSLFWSLFNDQHEVILGARGCGKTILLKMMRYSMLRNIDNEYAKKLVEEKKYIAFYIPLHLEFIKRISSSNLAENEKINWFRFSFNCVLAQAILLEIEALINDIFPDEIKQISTEYRMSEEINNIWKINTEKNIHQFHILRDNIYRIYYNSDPYNMMNSNIPASFTHSLGSSLTSISDLICSLLQISPTWILCVDEAEFIDECYQKCINTAFRSDTNRIAIKMATLPFYHITKKTLDSSIEVMNGQDFKYTVLDLRSDHDDFVNITNTIVRNRLAKEGITVNDLKEFVLTIGNDNYIDYYENEMGKEKGSSQFINAQIMSQISINSQKHNEKKTKSELKKPLFDKLAPVFYVREIYKKKRGHYIPQWYAGANMIRRIAQGNPRLFIRIMNDLFDCSKGKKLPISLKKQHSVIEKFADSFCKETKTLEGVGPEAEENLNQVSKQIQKKTHGPRLSLVGISFMLKNEEELMDHQEWIKKAVAFSRLFVDNNCLFTEITHDTPLELSNLYAANYWLPMRAKPTITIHSLKRTEEVYLVKTPNLIRTPKRVKNKMTPGQISMFFDEEEDND